jgi:hypothetical protein
MAIKLANNASSTLATAISASDTGVVLATGTGSQFPVLTTGDYFYATIVSTAGTREIVKATARVGDTLTIVRAQEGTTAASFAAGAQFELRITAASVLDNASESTSALAAPSGSSLVGYLPDGSGAVATTVQAQLRGITASSGSSLVGYLPVGTGAVATTVQGKLREVVSVKDFGAVGDGVVDDTTNIQNAINYCTADLNNPKSLFFPAGDYRITTGFSNITCKNFRIYGDGRGVEVFTVGVDNQGASRIVYDGADNLATWIFDLSNARGCQISQLSILCEGKCNAIRATLSSNLMIEKLGIYEAYTGIYFIASCFSSVIDNVMSYDHKTNHIVFDETAHSTKITNCSFASLSGGTTTPNSVITMGDADPMSMVTISGCNFDVHRVPVSILAKRIYGLAITGNYFEPRDVTMTRIIQLGDQVNDLFTQGVNIAGNKLFGTAFVGDGIRIEEAYGVNIVGNIFNSMTNAVNCADTGVSANKFANGVSISGNRFASAMTGYGLTFDNAASENIVMLGNTGRPDYDPTQVGSNLYFAEEQFTPVLAFGGASVGVTYSTQVGRYKKIGSRIIFQIRLVVTSKGSSTGNATITGLPFTSVGSIPQTVPVQFISGFVGLTGSPEANINTSATDIVLGQTTATGRSVISNTVFGSGTITMSLSGFYEIAV